LSDTNNQGKLWFYYRIGARRHCLKVRYSLLLSYTLLKCKENLQNSNIGISSYRTDSFKVTITHCKEIKLIEMYGEGKMHMGWEMEEGTYPLLS
jgi:hypothetical protein